jgi:hypothetical protein
MGGNMKDWLRQQTTEFTAWTGFFIVLAALFAPRWVLVALGVLLICWDDDSAKSWMQRMTKKTEGTEK